MKIAIFHDFFGSIGGGEKLVLELAKGLNADIITSDLDSKNLEKVESKGVRIINIGNCVKIPILKHIQSSIKFRKANFPEYDFYIISGNWSIFAAKKHKPNLFYCHTPVRMFYDSYKYFYSLTPKWGKAIFYLWTKIHSYFIEKNIRHLQKIISNSKNTQKRVKKYYKRNSKVIFPPIKRYKYKKNGNFWLSVNRIYPHKRVEMQTEAFRKMPKEKLLIVGGIAKGDYASEYQKKVLKNMPKNVEILREVSEEELGELYGNCRGFITTSREEDFGMTVLEAMSAGKPVIAPKEGGYKESITGKTGVLIEDITSKKIIKAIQKMNKKLNKNPKKYKKECEKRAEKFSIERFVERIKAEIKF